MLEKRFFIRLKITLHEKAGIIMNGFETESYTEEKTYQIQS